MTCDTDNRLVVEINQGVNRGYAFTIMADNIPMNLTNYKVRFAVKIAPYYSLKSLIEKEISIDSDENTIGRITDPVNGKFQVQLTKEDTLKLPPNDYALIMQLTDGEVVTNISGVGKQFGLFRVCGE